MSDVRKAMTFALLTGLIGLGVACDGSSPRSDEEFRTEERGSEYRSEDIETVDIELKDGAIDMPDEIDAGTVVLAIKNDDNEQAHGLAIERTSAVDADRRGMMDRQTGRAPQDESMRDPEDDPLTRGEPQPEREPQRTPGTAPGTTPGTTPGAEPGRTPGAEPQRTPETEMDRDAQRQTPGMDETMAQGENLLENIVLQPGEKREVTVTLTAGTYRVYCPQGGHQKTEAEEHIVTVVAGDDDLLEDDDDDY